MRWRSKMYFILEKKLWTGKRIFCEMRLYARNTVRSPRKKSAPLLAFTSHFQSFSPPSPVLPTPNPQSVFQLGRKNLIRALNHRYSSSPPSPSSMSLPFPILSELVPYSPSKNLTLPLPFSQSNGKRCFWASPHQSLLRAKLLSHLALKLLLASQDILAVAFNGPASVSLLLRAACCFSSSPPA